MKVTYAEYEQNFHIALSPENVKECAFLMRIGLGHTKELLGCSTYASRESFDTFINIGKAKNPKQSVG